MVTDRRCRRLRRISAVALGAWIAGSCERAGVAPVIEWEQGDGFRSRPLVFQGVRGGRFRAVSPRRSGVSAAVTVDEERRLENRTLAHGAGVALGDVDGDGRIDLYLCRLEQTNVLYRNLGGWRFQDVTPGSGAALAGVTSRGAVLADADGDGDLDLFVSVHGGPNLLLANDGAGHFERREAGFEGAFGTNTAALADVDADGDLDVFFANYKTIQADDLFSPAERAIDRIARRTGEEIEVRPGYAEHYRVERVGDAIRRWELADPDEFYLNDGEGRFHRVAFEGGTFLDEDGRPLETAPRAWGLVARFFDMDDDGDPDLYVANDFGSPDGIWLNEGGRFRAASTLAIRTTSASSMGVDFADVDADGDTDFITTEMLALDPGRRRRQSSDVSAPSTPPGGSRLRVSAGRNALQLSRGDGTFAEAARAAGLAASEWTWGALFLDVDLDGYEDLLVTTGHVWDPLDGDTQDALRAGRVAVDWRRELSVFPPLELRNLAFRNRGDGTFAEAGERWGYGVEPDISHGIGSADLDRDGDLDVVVTRFGQPPLLLRNDTGEARIAVRLWGRPGNTRGVGARVTLRGGAVDLQTRQVTSGGMYLSGSDPLLVFAMGARDSATLEVAWPSGGRTRLAVGADRLYEIQEPVGAELTPTPVAPVPATPERPALFEFAGVGGRHDEGTFDELARQPLVPLELSRGGPGVSWEDVDGDGDPDLVTGGSAGGRAWLVRIERGALTRPVRFGAVAPGDQTTILGVPSGLGPGGPGGGRRALVAGISTWEARSPEELRSMPGAMRLDSAGSILPGSSAATGPLAMADTDGDGDLELFVGGRALPAAYPLPATSRMLVRDGEGWAEDPLNLERFRAVGLVSGAVFSDVDADGDPDLLLALDWGPVRLFTNEGGRFEETTDAWGLAGLSGRWNGIATGDLDGDGRPDLVVAGWGLNLDPRPTATSPAGFYAGDFDGNGTFDLLEYATDSAGLRRPVRDYRTLVRALPFLRRAAPTFEAFARATVEELVGDRTGGVYRAEAVTTAHTVFLNRGGRFEPRPLPFLSQLAPAHGVVVADFDRDGAEDVFLSQNYLATPPGIDRFDAGRGALLLGDGRGGFRPSGGVSGVAAYGDGRGAAAADYDGDGRWDLAVGQNGEETRVYRGRGGAPGLRVRLWGGAGNPEAVGAAVRVEYASGPGPMREVQSGSGYWSRNGAVQVFARTDEPRAVHVRWPGGEEEVYGWPVGATEVTIARAGVIAAVTP